MNPTANKVISFLIIGVCTLVFGCRDSPTTTWSTEARSSDGHWLAVARSQQWSGPGNAYDATTVSLKRTDDSEPPTQILLFSHDSARMDLKMKWATPSHLDVAYGSHARLDFQVAKCAGIDISVQDLSNEATNPSQ